MINRYKTWGDMYGLRVKPPYGMSGMGIEPVTIGLTVFSAIGKLIGAAPRGEHQKFQRNMYPAMAKQAQATQIPVICYWFGETIIVQPNGQYSVLVSKDQASSYQQSYAIAAQKLSGQAYYITQCSSDDCANHPENIYFGDPENEEYVSVTRNQNPQAPTGTSQILAGLGSMDWGTLATVGIVAMLALTLIGSGKKTRGRRK